MFSADTQITMHDGTLEEIGKLAEHPWKNMFVRTKGGGGPLYYSAYDDNDYREASTKIVTPYARMLSQEGLKLITKCEREIILHPKAKICLAGGGYMPAYRALAGMVIDTDSGPDHIGFVDTTNNFSNTLMFSIRLVSVHAVLANGIWFLTE